MSQYSGKEVLRPKVRTHEEQAVAATLTDFFPVSLPFAPENAPLELQPSPAKKEEVVEAAPQQITLDWNGPTLI